MKRNIYLSSALMLILSANALSANAESVVYKADDFTNLTGDKRVETLSENLTLYHDITSPIQLGEGVQTFDGVEYSKYFNLPKSHVTTVGEEQNAIGIKVNGDCTLYMGGIGGSPKEKNIAVWYVKNGKASYITKTLATPTKGNPFSGMVSCKTGANEIFVGVIGGAAGIHFIKVIPFMTPNLKSDVVTTDIETEQSVNLTGGYFVNNPGVEVYYRWIDDETPEAAQTEASTTVEGYTLYDKNSVPTFNPVTTRSAVFEYYATDGTDKGEVKRVTFTAKEGVTTGIEDIQVKEPSYEEAPAYDLYGRPVDNNYKGIIIKKGKKEYRY